MEIHAWQEGRLTGMSVDLKKEKSQEKLSFNMIVEDFYKS